MVHNFIDERNERKKRGRPPTKNIQSGKPKYRILDNSGLKASDEPKIEEQKVEVKKEIIKEKTKEIVKVENEQQTLDFYRNNDKLSIKYSKQNNRTYRLQIFLNDELEIRPVSYTGASTGNSYWTLLKGSLKNEKNSC